MCSAPTRRDEHVLQDVGVPPAATKASGAPDSISTGQRAAAGSIWPVAPSVLHVAQPTEGGVAKAVLELADDQRARGWQVTAATPPDPAITSELGRLGVRHLSWPATRNPGPATLLEVARLRRLLGLARPGLVHLHSSKAGLCGRLLLGGRTPTIFQPHGWSFAAAQGRVRTASVTWERRAARWAHALLCVSGEERTCGEREGVHGRYAVVPNGVDVDRFVSPSAQDVRGARVSLGLDGPRVGPVLVCVGRLSRQKGQDLLLAAWPRIREAFPHAVLVLVGDGPERPALAAAGLPDVLMPGWAADPLPWLWAADLVVLPSRWEGLAYAVLEAMAAGRSVVASDAAGMREALGSGLDRVGAVVPVGDVAALAQAVLERLADPGLRAAEGRRARARAVELFDARVQREAVADLTLALLATSPSLRASRQSLP